MNKEALIRGAISVRPSPIHGRGVFADTDIKTGEIIEECHCIILHYGDDVIFNYTFKLDIDGELKIGCVLGYGAIYNHSNHPNADFKYDAEQNVMRFTAIKDIKSGEEICTSYGDHWFGDRSAAPIQTSIKYRIKRFFYRYQRLMRMTLLIIALLLLIKFITYSPQF